MRRSITLLLILALLLAAPIGVLATESSGEGGIASETTAATSIYDDGGYPNTWVNTGDMALDICEVAKTQVGYTEIPENHTKYNLWYYGTDNTNSWCGIFIAWCADQAGVPTSILPKRALASGYSVSNMNNNIYGLPAYSLTGGTAPEPGDIAFCGTGGSSTHVALIVDVDDSWIYTVEGNASDSVGTRKYSRTTGGMYMYETQKILFFVRPPYEKAPCAAGHTYTATLTPATCLEAGYITYTCSICGDTYTEVTQTATGHYAGTLIRASQYGSVCSCGGCGTELLFTSSAQYTVHEIPATCTDDGYYLYISTNGSSTLMEASGSPATGHSFGSWVVSTPSTATEYGVQSRYCQNSGCSESISQELPYLNPFTDLGSCNSYYYIPVLWANSCNITNGTSGTAFTPGGNCTRAQVVTFLWRAAGEPEPTLKESPFEDVQDPSAYYYDAVLWAYECGITDGMSPTLFNPFGTVTRAQVVTFLWRAAGKPEADASAAFVDQAFADTNPGSYYYDAVAWAVNNSVTNGISDTLFAPSNTCIRGQVVTFLYRYITQ